MHTEDDQDIDKTIEIDEYMTPILEVVSDII